MVGIHAFLVWCPLWALALILYLATDCVIHILRDWKEGLGYQVSYSAKIGDAGLIGCVLIAATILKRGNLVLPDWLMNANFHYAFMLGVLLLCIALEITLKSRSCQLADIYHDLVIAPAFLYFAVTLLPVIYLGGRFSEKFATFCLVCVWAALVIYDIYDKRMDQRRWLQRHGIVLR